MGAQEGGVMSGAIDDNSKLVIRRKDGVRVC